jgi:hypothetical protein
MAWQPPAWSLSAEQLNDRWMGTCRKFWRHHEFFVALGWGDRLNRLFAVACVRAANAGELCPTSEAFLDLAERRADGELTDEELASRHDALFEALEALGEDFEVNHDADYILSLKPEHAAGLFATKRQSPYGELFGRVLAAMVGPGLSWSDSWRTAAVTDLARGIYAERAWDRMPILSDALVDAGCGDAKVRAYCRGSGPFMRGCRVLDDVLGKRV